MIEFKNIHKSFEDVHAVDDVSLNIEEGELFGFIGPDGSGKTTLFRMLNSLLIPNEGQISLFGLDPVKEYKKVRQIIGYMPGKFSLYYDLSIEENLQFFATVFGTTIEENYHLIEDIYKQIEPFKKRPAGKLSGGMKQKLALSCALIHKPRLLLLDEPTTGVDAVSRREFWEMLQKLKEKGITIVVSTPYMDEAGLCDRVALMQNGKIHAVAPPSEIVAQFSDPLYSIKVENNYKSLQALRQWEHCENVYPFGETLHYLDKRNHVDVKDIEAYLSSQQLGFNHVELIQPDIEDCFIALTHKVG
nr:ABC transporter ATP-binding protein [uncultured Carboxylicivirga sp.]